MGSTPLYNIVMFQQCFWMWVFSSFVVGVMCPFFISFFDSPHSGFAPIYVVIVVDAALFPVDTYVGLLTHILEWRYQLLIYGNPA